MQKNSRIIPRGSPFELLILLDSVNNAEHAVQGRIASASEEAGMRGENERRRAKEAEGKEGERTKGTERN